MRKFAEILAFPNVYECYDVTRPELVGEGMRAVDLRGKWNSLHFRRSFPITLELACGGGEYTIGLAERFLGRHFIGVDVKGNRLWLGAKQALDRCLENVAFLRARIEVIDRFFEAGEVTEIWITFADPFPRASKENRRLTSPMFLELYRRILVPGGVVHLKHDDPDFVAYTLGVVEADSRCCLLEYVPDVYGSGVCSPELGIQTLYEGKHLAAGKTIKYLKFTIS